MAVFTGTDPEAGRMHIYLETLGDGKDGVQEHIAPIMRKALATTEPPDVVA